MLSPIDVVRRLRTLRSGRLHALPVLVLMPHSRCNCRCVMCDIWRANRDRRELSVDDLEPHLQTLRRLRTRWVVLSGGEALLHSNLWTLCGQLRALKVRLTLLSSGLTLERHAASIVEHVDEVIVSLDGTPEIHNQIRGIPEAYQRLAHGTAALRRERATFRVTARCVLQRLNYRHLPEIAQTARDLELDQISFLAADVASEAFNRPGGWPPERQSRVALSATEAKELSEIVERCLRDRPEDFTSGFVAESPQRLRELVAYTRALARLQEEGAAVEASLPTRRCNAPWVSAVLEADGTVRPCFFHRALGNIHQQPLETVLNSPEAIAFRNQLDVARDPICRRCVCSLHLPLLSDLRSAP